MKSGDLVRFTRPEFPLKEPNHCSIWQHEIGLLVEYKTWEKIATVLIHGKLERIRASELSKAGKKDGLVF
tara:strand:- start:12286 stop:12495 length:210 start_codon:yes stop_codon:yes gene_type:complete